MPELASIGAAALGGMVAAALAAGVAGWSVALAMTLLWSSQRIRRTRLEAGVCRGLHEMRRPLQAIEFGLGRGDRGIRRDAILEQVRLASLAIADLEAAVEESEPATSRRRISLARHVERSVARWGEIVAARGRALELRWTGADAEIVGEPLRLEQALDNLIDNALEHGTGAIAVEGRVEAGRARVTIRDDGPGRDSDREPAAAGLRHGHGLKIVRSVADGHGGRFAFHRSRAGSRATIELPATPRLEADQAA